MADDDQIEVLDLVAVHLQAHEDFDDVVLALGKVRPAFEDEFAQMLGCFELLPPLDSENVDHGLTCQFGLDRARTGRKFAAPAQFLDRDWWGAVPSLATLTTRDKNYRKS